MDENRVFRSANLKPLSLKQSFYCYDPALEAKNCREDNYTGSQGKNDGRPSIKNEMVCQRSAHSTSVYCFDAKQHNFIENKQGSFDKRKESWSKSSDSDRNNQQKKKTDSEVDVSHNIPFVPMWFSRQTIAKTSLQDVTKICLSFSGCGFIGAYHFGVARCLLDHGKELLKKVDRYAGASAGSLVASLLALCPEKIDDGVEVFVQGGGRSGRFTIWSPDPRIFFLNDKLFGNAFLPENISRAQNRLFISVTNLHPYSNEVVSHYSSRTNLVHYLLASCYIPMYSMGYSANAPVVDGKTLIDGGYTNNLPIFTDRRTVTCSPFSGDADISPEDSEMMFRDWMFSFGKQNLRMSSANWYRGKEALFPPTRAILTNYHQIGFTDAKRFLMSHKLYNNK
ncbi:unnamed protein product [Caenorhabditis auriculariae]|uniref:PNPLA domain-containing protein n=1 Tax=Caenorhabditis auriculariae TaxID=2777116 RepID=A0A8S1HU86_9PELO|nr:unnamed protein product [Caenorhabditis auriculariae]